MPGTSSLLRSASSQRKKVLAQQDAEAEYEYSLGYKDYDDYRAYDRYLEKRAKSTTDPGAALSLQKKRNSAFRGYISNEIQRQSINVLEGRSSNVDKYNAMYQLYQSAVANGMYDQAQTLYLQLDNLDKTIQNEAIAGAGSARAAATAARTAVKDEVDAHKAALQEFGAYVQSEGGIDGLNKALDNPEAQKALIEAYPDLAQVYQQGGKIGMFDIINGIFEGMKDTYARGISELPPDDAAKLQADLDKLITGQTTVKIPGVFKDAVSLKDIQQQIAQAREGRSYFFRGQDGVLQKGSVTDYTWDRNGKAIPVYADPLSAGTQDNPYLQTVDNFKDAGSFRRDEKGNFINDKGQVVARYKDGQVVDASGQVFKDQAAYNEALKGAKVDAATLLREQGFNVAQNGDGGFVKGENGGVLVTVTEETRQKLGDIPGVQNGNAVEVFVDGQGNLRYSPSNSGKIYQGAIDEKGNVNFRELAPGEQGAISSQGRQNLAVDMRDMQGDLSNKGISAVTGNSLVASNNRIAEGIGFTRGVLKDAEVRRRFLAGEEIKNARNESVRNDVRVNPALKLNTRERIVNTGVRSVGGATRAATSFTQNPYKTLGSVLRKLSLRKTQGVVFGVKKVGSAIDRALANTAWK